MLREHRYAFARQARHLPIDVRVSCRACLPPRLGTARARTEESQIAIEVGATITATVARIENYGAFLQLEDGRMGLVHISEIDRNYVKDVREHLREGDSVEAKVVAIKDDGKIDLSIKALQDPAPPRRAARLGPRVRADAEEVHAPERGAPGRLPARHRAQAQVAAGTVPPELRGSRPRRRPRAARPRAHHPFTVVARCPAGIRS